MKKSSKKKKKVNSFGVVYIQSTFNNTIVTVTDLLGNTISWASAGSSGFKGSRKGTAFAGQMASELAGNKAREAGVKSVDIKVKGPGPGREGALRSIFNTGLKILSVEDQTTLQHNGCRPPKRRRV